MGVGCTDENKCVFLWSSDRIGHGICVSTHFHWFLKEICHLSPMRNLGCPLNNRLLKTRSLMEKGLPQPCFYYFMSSLAIHYQPLFDLFSLCSGTENSHCDPSGQVGTSWRCGSVVKPVFHWFIGSFSYLSGGKDIRRNIKFEWEKIVHLYGEAACSRVLSILI